MTVQKGYYKRKSEELGVPWYWIPGEELFTKTAITPAPRKPLATAVWPIGSNRKWFYKFTSNGPNGMGCFGYKRPGQRTHAGVDLPGKSGDIVRAIEDGRIVSFYHFLSGTWAILVDHGDITINYSEVDSRSMDYYFLTPRYYKERGKDMITTGDPGSTVKAGDPIGRVGLLPSGSSMCHLELYTSGVSFNKRWLNFPTGVMPSGMYDPTDYMLSLAGTKVHTKEVIIPASPCR